MAGPPLVCRGFLDQPAKHTVAGTMEAMLDGYGFGLLSGAAVMFPTAFPEDQHPRPWGAPTDRTRRRSGSYLDRVIGYAIRRGRAWLSHSASNR
jgi:hypothetical protein